MNPHTQDHRLFRRDGEKTGDPLQLIGRPRRPSAWLWFSTGALMTFVALMLCALPWEGGW